MHVPECRNEFEISVVEACNNETARGGWPRLIMHAQRGDVITAICQDDRDLLEVIFKQVGHPGQATAVWFKTWNMENSDLLMYRRLLTLSNHC